MMNPDAHEFVPTKRSPLRTSQHPRVAPCVCGAPATQTLSCNHFFCRDCIRREFATQVLTTTGTDVVCPICYAPVPDRELKPLLDAAVFARLAARRPIPAARMRTPSPPSSPHRGASTVVIVPLAMNVHTLQNPPRSPSPISIVPGVPASAAATTSSGHGAGSTSPSAPSSPPAPQDQSSRLRQMLLSPDDGGAGSDQFICSLPPDFWTSTSGMSSDLMAVAAASS